MSETDLSEDLKLYNAAFSDVKKDLVDLLKRLEKPASVVGLVNLAADLSATAERFSNLTRGVIDLQKRAVI